MGLFDDLSRFLESRLEEFLQNNPHLELQALDEQLREQETTSVRLLGELRQKEQQSQNEILETAQEIQLWHTRIAKAEAAGRMDLVKPAKEREAALLRQGNQIWGQMKVYQERIQQTEELQRKIQVRRQEVQAQLAAAQANRAQTRPQNEWETSGWAQSRPASFQDGPDPLDSKFRNWEMEEELEQLKRKMGR